MNRKKAVRRLRKALVSGRRKASSGMASAMKAGSKTLKAASKRLKEAERSGALDQWRARVGMALRALEVAAVATAAYKGATVKVGKPRAAAKRGNRKTAKPKAAR